ncbi:TPA: right-handed parallel beta-helix repeat-containing protein, partial [Citrobacter amalonaticus]|nr:right-handed parallel beta-helix repeat-containing protein [Citrobacter amalonaticus]
MSVPNQTPYIIYNANGLTTVFPFDFYIINASDIQVSINGTPVATGFTVSGAGNVSGGDITFVTPPANGAVVMLERVVPTYRLTDYQDNGDLLASTVNKDFDRLWMAIQRSFIYLGLALRRPLLGGPFDAERYRISELADPINDQDAATKKYVEQVGQTNLNKTLRVPESFVRSLQPVELRRNKLFAWDSLGDPISVLPESGSAADVMIELAKPTGAGMIGALPSGNIQETISWVTPEQYGAHGDGLTDDSNALLAAISSGYPVWIRQTYLITVPLILESGTVIFGNGEINSTNQTDSVIKIINALNVKIDGISIKRSLAANPGDADMAANILVSNSQKVRINLVSSTISSIGSCVLITDGSRDVNVTGCLVTTDGSFDPSELQTSSTVASPNGIFIADSSRDVLVFGNTCEIIGHGVMIQNVSGLTPIFNITISNNNIRKCSSYGIISYRLSESIYNVNITDNTIEDIYGTYYNTATPATPYTHGSGIYGQNVHRHVVKGNLIRNVCVSTNNFGTLSPAGIGFGSVTGFDISNNIISLSGSNG